ncbi:MAG: Calx-beta domain-containing protein, partial [Solirubrobacteraceae bacterium]|nr:Calx-beta domain-containing protein [Solirubrobacteraceae bacterium]
MRRAQLALLPALSALVVAFCLTPAARASSGTFDRLWGTDVVTGGGTGFETCVAAPDCKAGVGTAAAGGALSGPADVAIGPDGNVYVADTGNNRVQVFSAAGAFIRAFGWGVDPASPNALGTCTVAANCLAGAPESQNGSRSEGGRLDEPRGIAVGQNGHVYVTEFRAHRLSEFTATGDFVRLWGVRVNDALAGDEFEICPAAQADQCTFGLAGGSSGPHGGGLETPMGVDIDSQGDVYVADTGNRRIQKFTSAGQWLFTWGAFVYNSATPPDGNPNRCDDAPMCKSGNPSGLGTGFQRPAGIAIGPGDKVFVHDGYRVSRFSSAGTFERTWGSGVTGSPGPGVCTVAADCFAGQGGPAGGEFYLGTGGIAVDATGEVHVSDGQRIQRFDGNGAFEAMWGRGVDPAAPNAFGLCLVATTCDYGLDGTLGGELSGNAGVAIDPSGRLYVADAGNHRIVRYAAGGAIPARPTITAISTTAPASSTQPAVTGTAGPGTTVRLYDNPSCTGMPLATGTAAAFASPGLSISVALDATVTIYATATNSEGTSACSTSTVTYTEASGPVNTQVHFAAATASTPESTPGLVLTVQRTGDLTRTTTVKWAAIAGTAKPFAAVGGGDFTGDGATLTFAPGETTKTITIAIIGDGRVEGDETLSVALSEPSARVAL